MKNVNFLAGLFLSIFYACIGSMTNGQNKCFECSNLQRCIGPARLFAQKDDIKLIVPHMDNITYHPELPCVPDGYEIQGTVQHHICFHKPRCTLVVEAKTTGALLLKKCNVCAKTCKCKEPPMSVNMVNKCYVCENLESCVGPQAVTYTNKDKDSVVIQYNNITYQPDLECIPGGYIVKNTLKDYVCFHKPQCGMVAGTLISHKNKENYCNACGRHCKCKKSRAAITISVPLISICCGIYAKFYLILIKRKNINF